MFVDCCVHTAVYKRKQSLTIKNRLIADQTCRSGYTQPTPHIKAFTLCFTLPYYYGKELNLRHFLKF